MWCQWQLRQGMHLPLHPDRLLMTDVMDHFDSGTSRFQGEAMPVEDGLVGQGVQIGKTIAELELLSVDGETAPGALPLLLRLLRKSVRVDAEEPADAGMLQLEKAGCPVVGMDMHHILLHGPEDPHQHIVEVHTDVGGNTTGFGLVALPGGVVPVAAGGDVSEVDVDLGRRGVEESRS